MFKPDILLVDINGLGYACMYLPAFNRLSVNGFQTGAIHGALSSLFAYMDSRPGAVPIVLWDNRANWRYSLLPEYKGNRSDTPEKVAIKECYKTQTPVIRMMLTALGIPQISCGEAEADDLAGHICREIDPSWNIELGTKDTDWYQSLKENVAWYSSLTKKYVTLESLADPNNGMECNFLSTKEYLEAKALAGDTSDYIPGIDKVGLKTAVKIMREHGGTIDSFWTAVDEGRHIPKGSVQERLANQESRDIFKRNKILMDWGQAPAIKTEYLALIAGKPDWDQAQDIANEYGLVKAISKSKIVMKAWPNGWGDALWAVDAALNQNICQIHPKKNIEVPKSATYAHEEFQVEIPA